MKIKKDDNVIVISGKDRGKKGKVLRALPKEGLVVVEGINMRKRHTKPKKSGQKGQIIDITLPLPASNVMVIDGKTGKGTRVGYRMDGDKKVRFAKKSGAILN